MFRKFLIATLSFFSVIIVWVAFNLPITISIKNKPAHIATPVQAMSTLNEKKSKGDTKEKSIVTQLENFEEVNTTTVNVQEKELVRREVVLGSSTTHFYGSSAGRIQNIKNGARKINGKVVMPNEEFSTLSSIGNITYARGFADAWIISYGKTVKGIGGGLCQISTTLFRAALQSGLPITERHGHSYIVGYYGSGLDATIYGPWLDMKFRNDTRNPIRIESKTTNNSVTFIFYGIYDGREATISPVAVLDKIYPPKPLYMKDYSLKKGRYWCIESASIGMTTSVDYTVEYNDGNVNTQLFKTKYKPWQKKCYVGAK